MSKRVQHRRGTTTQHATFTGADGEITVDTDLRCLRLHDGSTAGGKVLNSVLLNPASSITVQTVAGPLIISGYDSDNQSLNLAQGLTVGGPAIFSGRTSLLAIANTQSAITYAANVALAFDQYSSRRIALTGNLSLSATGHAYGARMELIIASDGSARNLTFPGTWVFIGAAAPASIAASKVGILELWCRGTTEADVLARWTVQP